MSEGEENDMLNIEQQMPMGGRRSLTQINATDFLGKLRSKADFYSYMDKERK